jgi:hypothetical protein
MKNALAALVLVFLPAIAFAQASITGVVRDSSGGVLPGVTVEAASPALIEKVRVVVTDGAGQYRIVDLRPGTYAVTFSLAGFNTAKREGIELTGSFTATVDADMRVGALEETINVTARASTVDVQSTTQQRVMTKEVVDVLPTGRRVYDAGVLIPGVTTNVADVGGTGGPGANTTLSVHGSRQQDQRVTVGGLAVTNLDGQGGIAAYNPNLGSSEEITFDTSGSSAENPLGGVLINVIPKEGGNRFSGTVFGTAVTSGFQGANYDDDLKTRGFLNPNRIKRLFDLNPGIGGPILRDRLWFYSSSRWQETTNYVGGMFYNANAGKTTLPAAWLYAPDLSQPAWSRSYTRSVNGRITWQAATKDKLSFFYDDQAKCSGCPGATSNQSPETTASGGAIWPIERFASASWTSVRTSRLLLDVSAGYRDEHWEASKIEGADHNTIPVTDQLLGITYHGLRPINNAVFANFDSSNWTARASVSYVTGSHSLKAGVTDVWGTRVQYLDDNASSLSYRFNNGIPNQITQRATPFSTAGKLDGDLGLFVQDRWTLHRLTVNAGVRFDWFRSSFPDQHLAPALWVPARDVQLPGGDLVNWTDLSPRLGIAYDLAGDGRTALKVSLNRYVVGNALHGLFGEAANPVSRFASIVTRSWTDGDTDFTPDCDLVSPDANGECGPISDRRFGQALPSFSYDSETLKGFGKRGYNWEFSAGVQRQLIANLSAEAAYFRRSYGNNVVMDNRATTAADYTRFSIPVPVHPQLPGSGSVLEGFYDLNPNKVGQVDNYVTFADTFGKWVEMWQGVDLSVNARNLAGLLLQGGVSTGRTTSDKCEVTGKLPEVLAQAQNAFSGFATTTQPSDTWCRTAGSWLTQVKLLGAYTIPKIAVQASATLQSLPGPEVSGTYVATNAVVGASLGRPLSANAPSASLQLVRPGTLFGERLNQIDLRFARKIAIGRTSTSVNLDVYNLTNGNAVMTENASFAVFRRPTSIAPARFAKVSVQFNF